MNLEPEDTSECAKCGAEIIGRPPLMVQGEPFCSTCKYEGQPVPAYESVGPITAPALPEEMAS
jgi:hypothetical protein